MFSMKRALLALVLLLPFSFTHADPQLTPFLPLNLPIAGSSSAGAGIWWDNATSTGGAGFQVPLVGQSPNAQIFQLKITNFGSASIYVASGPTQASVASVVLPTAGSNTIAAGGNARAVLPLNQVIFSFPIGYWFNVSSSSGTQLVEIEAGTGH